MALNIKNPKAHALARELAELTGTSITTAVIATLRQQLTQRRNDELMLIGQRCAAHLPQPLNQLLPKVGLLRVT